MNRVILRLTLISVVAASQSAQLKSQQTEFVLFGLDKGCVCVTTKKETMTIQAAEKTEGKLILQIFSPLNEPKHELFRVTVGEVVGSDAVKWWNYGIADEADFNGDGMPDYSWYGGDDTSQAMYLFLSSDRGYRKVDVIKTLELAWRERFHHKAPDLAVEEEYVITSTILRRSPSGLMLVAKIKRHEYGQTKEETFTFEIEESRFAP